MSKEKNTSEQNSQSKRQTAHAECEMLRKKLDETQTKLAQALSLAREYKSDMERMKERAKEVEMQKTVEIATKAVLEILPVLDNFELALAKIADDAAAKGFKLIHAQLAKVVEDLGAKQIENGTEFNPELHEAISTLPPQSDEQKGKIAHIVQNGYVLFGKVIRASKVVVYGND